MAVNSLNYRIHSCLCNTRPGAVRGRLRGVQPGHPSLVTREAAGSKTMRYRRQVGAASVEAAVATYSARYHRHWGAEPRASPARAAPQVLPGIPTIPSCKLA